MKHPNLSKPIAYFVKVLAGCLLLGSMLTEFAFALEEVSEEAHIAPVGEVSLVLGKAYIKNSDGARELIKVGATISESDLIETGSNGHVHIRFVDGALVSVRPASQLEILRYDYNAEAPQNSVVKFNLVEGVARAISGKAAKAARENFRMDTPIAAIGVRGTDFVVSSNSDGVRASVKEGAIVIAPYSAECSAAAFGPCSLNALELTGGAGQIAQIEPNGNEALLLSLSTPAIPEAPQQLAAAPVAATALGSSETKTNGEGIYTDSVTAKTVTRELANARNGISIPPIRPPDVTTAPEFTPDISLSDESLTANQLVWGRWYAITSEFDRIATFRDTAIADGRKITVRNDIYGLYRPEPDGKDLKRGLGELGFNLNQAQAILRADGQSDLMNVTGGMLNIDFNKNLYSTNLQMNHAMTGNVEFSDSGRITSTGIFGSSTRNGPDFLSGAVSVDGTEAGYFFEKTLQSGALIEGLTLWGVKP